MGTWGPGNFESDGACDYRDDFVQQLFKTIEACLAPNYRQHFDIVRDGEEKLMASLDMLIVLCKAYDISPHIFDIESDVISGWKETYLRLYDEKIDDYDPKPNYKVERRTVIASTFDKLEEIAHR
jgi:hypothetical protein